MRKAELRSVHRQHLFRASVSNDMENLRVVTDGHITTIKYNRMAGAGRAGTESISIDTCYVPDLIGALKACYEAVESDVA